MYLKSTIICSCNTYQVASFSLSIKLNVCRIISIAEQYIPPMTGLTNEHAADAIATHEMAMTWIWMASFNNIHMRRICKQPPSGPQHERNHKWLPCMFISSAFLYAIAAV